MFLVTNENMGLCLYMIDRLTGQINLTALAPLTILLVEHQALVKHRE